MEYIQLSCDLPAVEIQQQSNPPHISHRTTTVVNAIFKPRKVADSTKNTVPVVAQSSSLPYGYVTNATLNSANNPMYVTAPRWVFKSLKILVYNLEQGERESVGAPTIISRNLIDTKYHYPSPGFFIVVYMLFGIMLRQWIHGVNDFYLSARKHQRNSTLQRGKYKKTRIFAALNLIL